MIIGISSFCWECFNETSQTKEDYDRLKQELNSDVDFEVELNDENLYEFICPKGHRTLTQLQEKKFEILFDLASMALLDGYTKEAVSTYASSLERFIEFYILVVSLKNEVLIDDFIKTWKLMSRQSERQLGAFFILQLLGKKDVKWEEKYVSFRNKVVHQGYIPKSEEAIEYGQYVLSFISKLLKELNEESPESLEKANFIHLTKNGDKMDDTVRMSNASMPTIISLSSVKSEDFGKITLKDSLELLKGNGFYKHFYRKKI